MAKPALGRGLGVLLGGTPPTSPSPPASVPPATPETGTPHARSDAIRRVPIASLQPCPFQPRKEFTESALQELADSIREQGILQPLVVRERQNRFEIIAGERRWRAAQLIGLAQVPVIVREADDDAVLELALIENLQRENLNPLEEAQGYQQLLHQFHLTQEQIASKLGKNRVTVANSLRLLKLPAEVQEFLREGRLSVGHAKVVLSLPTPQQQSQAAHRILKQDLNVRQAEVLVAALLKPPGPDKSAPQAKTGDPNVLSLENRLREKLGTKIRLRYHQGRGALEINFFSDDELERILQLLGISAE